MLGCGSKITKVVNSFTMALIIIITVNFSHRSNQDVRNV